MREEIELDEAAAACGALPGADLLNQWRGVVWLKPHISLVHIWGRAMVARYRTGEIAGGLLLAPARTDTNAFQWLARQCTAVGFVDGRVRFAGQPSGAPFPSVVFYIGADLSRVRAVFEPLCGPLMRYLHQ